MKDRVLFAKAGIARFMALLVTLLTMFASCNFVGGQDARTPTAAVGDPGKNGGMFKNAVQGMGIQIYGKGENFGIDSEGNLVYKKGWGGAYGSYDKDGVYATGKYDVSKVAYVKFDLKADSEGSFGIQVFGDSENKWEQNFNRQDFKENEDSQEEMMVCKNLRINILSEKEYSEILFSLSGAMPVGAKVRIENFTFYDRNGKEIVPTYIKYPEVGKPEDPDKPVTGDDGEGTTFAGIFKSPIQGVDLCIWDESWTSGFILDGNVITAKDGTAAGGHFGSMDPDTKDTKGIDPYDVSKIAYAKCKFECDADVSGKAFSITLFGDGKIGQEIAIDSATANVAKEIKLDVLSNPGTSHTLFGIFIESGQFGKKFKISDFAFYDKGDNEVVPKLVETK